MVQACLIVSGRWWRASTPVHLDLPITIQPAGCPAFRPGFVLARFGCRNYGVRYGVADWYGRFAYGQKNAKAGHLGVPICTFVGLQVGLVVFATDARQIRRR
jgi:hypothetical protein